MANKLTFEKFLELARNRATPPAVLRDYIEFDPHSPIPRLRFRSDVLLDQPPATFDLDGEVRQIGRALDRARKRELRRSPAFPGLKRVVAEGDSWFELPWFFEVYAIAEWIERDKRFDMENVADYGHTLENILAEPEHMAAIREVKPHYFMLGAGGNDLQVGLAKESEEDCYIHKYAPNRPVDGYLTGAGEEGLRQIGRRYQELLNQVHSEFPTLPIFCHGYDYPHPRSLNGAGNYIGQHLKRRGIPDRLMGPIVNPVLDKLNDVLAQVTSSVETARYLDCRGKTGPSDWMDDMHPRNPGFKALAMIFENAMN